MKWVKPFAIGYEYVYISDKVNNLTTERLKPYGRKIINLIGSEGNKY